MNDDRKIKWNMIRDDPSHVPFMHAIERSIMTLPYAVRIDVGFENLVHSNCFPDKFLYTVGLLPICFDPTLLTDAVANYSTAYPCEQELIETGEMGRPDYKHKFKPLYTIEEGVPYHEFNEFQAIWFELDVTCTFNEQTQELEHSEVTGRDFIWKPIGTQLQRWASIPQKPEIVSNTTIQLIEGQRLSWTFVATKGMAREYVGYRQCRVHQTHVSPKTTTLSENIQDVTLHIQSINRVNPWYYLTTSVQGLIDELKKQRQAM